MQNTSQTFRGAGAPGVNFSDHSYDNHIGVHCQPAGYQPYTNPPYHPVPSPRAHHYGNHQMQQNMPYRHHGGAYAPNQNQYGQNMNQEMYRNHHSAYVGGPNSRNMSAKPWSENNAQADMMPPYGQVSHPQMMNNPSQMPVNSMRSPPHATSNMNPTPPQSQQHFRQMQSPAHSPHSWSQAQIPSPGVMHSSRTTPSPLPAHVRSPGHSQQPFSPPAAHAMNMPPHPQPPENGQMPPTMNAAPGGENHNPSNPLHSLQKMVMLDQDPSKAMLPMIGDGSEQFTNQCGSHNYVPDEGANNETKDSSYSTYYNMDENRFESKPNNSSNDSAAYSAVQHVSNCNFPVHPLNSEEIKNASAVSNSSNSSVSEGLHSDHTAPSPNSASSVPLSQCKPNIGSNDSTLNRTECPPHAESAPVFTDQTKAAVSTNSEQALESKTIPNSSSKTLPGDSETPAADIPNSQIAGEPVSSDHGKTVFVGNLKAVDESDIQIKCEKVDQNGEISDSNNISSLSGNSPLAASESSSDAVNESINVKSEKENISCNEEKFDLENTSSETDNSLSMKLSSETHYSNIDTEKMSGDDSSHLNTGACDGNAKKSTLRRRKAGASYEEAPSPESELKDNDSPEKVGKDFRSDNRNSPFKCDNPSNDHDSSDSRPIKDLARNPVKVVIHRIRKSDTNDTWHVPGNNDNNSDSLCASEEGEKGNDKKAETKIPNVGPQIIILSPAVPQKKFGFHSSVAENNVITVDEEDSIEPVEKEGDKDESNSQNSNNPANTNNASNRNPDKKRGRPIGSKNKLKPGVVKKKRGRKGCRKKKLEQSKSKPLENSSKSKRVKIFSGPYVHIVGSKENPSSIKVINVAQKEEEKISKVQPKRSFSSTVSRIKKKQVGHLSTLSPTYDAFNRDKTWLCVFCHKGSHHGGLGDLYGPYYIKDKNQENTKSSTATASTSSGSGSSRGKRRKSEPDDTRSTKRSKQSSGHAANESTPVKGSQNDSFSESEADLREVWIHEDCAVWCQSISLIGEEVQGLEEAVTEANENVCCQCSLHGATLGCWGKGCKEQYHYSCAKDTGCQMDIEKFSLLCPKHQKKGSERHNRCQ